MASGRPLQISHGMHGKREKRRVCLDFLERIELYLYFGLTLCGSVVRDENTRYHDLQGVHTRKYKFYYECDIVSDMISHYERGKASNP